MKQCAVVSIHEPDFSKPLFRPLFSWRIQAGFPSPAENYIEGRINLNDALVKHRLVTFYIRVIGDSMSPLIIEGELLVVDRMEEPCNRDIVVARIGDDLCVKRLRVMPDRRVCLMSENLRYDPIELTPEMDYEIWGVGRESTAKLKKLAITTALDLKRFDRRHARKLLDRDRRAHGRGARRQILPLELCPQPKKNICCSRSPASSVASKFFRKRSTFI